jgi:hypothetical protein
MKTPGTLVLVLWLAAQALLSSQRALPTPESVFGFPPGADNKLASYDQVVDYFQKIDAASDQVMLVDAGRTSRGRTAYFALVSSKANLARIDRYREIARQLAHPGALGEDEARRLAREGKAFVHIDGGLHSTEVAAPQHTPLLLYDILRRAAEGDRDMTAVLDAVVLMLWPTINPDGHQQVAEAYAARGGASGPATLAGLYQDYVGHDNNRDGYMLNMIESRMLEHTWRQWEPQIIYVHHQSAPFPTRIWLPPFAEPIATHAPYLLSREVNMIGMAIAQGLEERGQVGATHMGTGYDAWYPGYIDYAPTFKNIAAFWTETQGSGAAPRTTAREDLAPRYRDLRPESLYASPWPGGTWRFRDAVEYMETASLAVLEYAAKYKDNLLLNRYRAGRSQIETHRRDAPYAYVIPQDQRDPVAAVELLRRLAFGGVRVFQLTSEAVIDGTAFAAGTWVIPTDQEFIALAREVLDVQKYPDIRESPNGPLEQPYDAAGWTLPISMGVRVVPVSSPVPDRVRAAMRPLGPAPPAVVKPAPYISTSVADAASFDSVPGLGFDSDASAAAIVPPPGRATGTGPALAVRPAENNAFRAVNRAWKAGATVHFQAAAPADGPDAARYVITGLSAAATDDLVKALALRAERTAAAGAPMKRVRLGVFDQPTGMDHGWTRWVLERYEFEFTRITGADLEAGALRDTIDVLLLTDDARVVESGGGRGGRGGGPPPAGAGRAGGAPMAGGQSPASEARVRALDAFVKAGGTLVCFNRSTSFAIDQLHLPVRNVLAGVGRQEFFANGSLLHVRTDPGHRLMAGMPGEAAVFFDGSPVFEVQVGFTGAVLATYPDTGSPLASGYLLGEKHLLGRAAALDVQLGDGHVVLIGFRPQWRGQTFGTFRVIFNAALYGR